jgi:hypothetical protein
MNSKLTLSVDQKTIAKAKEIARQQGLSLSAMVESYLKSLSLSKTEDNRTKTSPIVAALKGSVKSPQNFDGDYKKAIQSYRSEKWESQ